MIKLPEPAFDEVGRRTSMGTLIYKIDAYTADQLKQSIQDALEEAAKVCDEQHDRAKTSPGVARAMFCADRIRVLKETIQ